MSDSPLLPVSQIPDGSVAVAPEVVVDPPKTVPPRSMKQKAIRGGISTAGGVTLTQMLAFASNIILSWVLVPEHFGVMALINTVITGLQMFSDVGITPCLIQNKREDPAFYNTAWTVQSIRGLGLWVIACLLAWPMSQVKADWAPVATLLPVAALTTVIAGFRSTGYVTTQRRMGGGKIAVIEFTTALIRTVVMIVFAFWVTETAWALVAGLLSGALFTTVVSHFMVAEVKNRFFFERAAFGEMIHYGKWLFLSTVITFFAMAADVLLIGKLASTAVLGVYWAARRFADLGPMIFQKIGEWIGLPALSEIYRSSREQFNRRLFQLRCAVLLPVMGLLLVMILLAPSVIYFFYRNAKDDAYFDAGWIIQVLSINAIGGLLAASYGNVYMATGRTKYNTLSVAAQFISVCACALTGYALGGEHGLFLGLGMAHWLKYVVDAELTHRAGCVQLKLDAAILICTASLAYFALLGSQWIAENVTMVYIKI